MESEKRETEFHRTTTHEPRSGNEVISKGTVSQISSMTKALIPPNFMLFEQKNTKNTLFL